MVVPPNRWFIMENTIKNEWEQGVRSWVLSRRCCTRRLSPPKLGCPQQTLRNMAPGLVANICGKLYLLPQYVQHGVPAISMDFHLNQIWNILPGLRHQQTSWSRLKDWDLSTSQWTSIWNENDIHFKIKIEKCISVVPHKAVAEVSD